MKISSALIALGAFFALSAGPAAAASQADYFGSAIDMGVTQIGQFGSITGSKGVFNNAAIGTIPAQSKIDFSYTLSGVNESSGMPTVEVSQGSYSYTYEGHDYAGSSSAINFPTPQSISASTIDGVASMPLIFASVGSNSPASGWIKIVNNSAGTASFMAAITALALSLGGQITATYVVSAVPLPAALPMFGFGLIALAGLRARRKKAQS